MLKWQRLFCGRCSSRGCRAGMQLLFVLALTWASVFFLDKLFSLIFMKHQKEQYRSISHELRIRGILSSCLGTCSTCWLSPGTVQNMLKQRLIVVQFFSAIFLTPAQCIELTGGPSPATGPFLLSLTVQMYGWVRNVITENILSRWRDSSPPSESKQDGRKLQGYNFFYFLVKCG